MRIARYRYRDSASSFGLVDGDRVRPLPRPPAPDLEDWLTLLPGAGEDLRAQAAASEPVRLSEVHLLAPLRRPRKFLGIGGNYASHLREIEALGVQAPHGQLWFNKQASCVNGPFDDVLLSPESTAVDYEGELAVVMGRYCRHVSINEAAQAIAGYMVCNDVSARDVQMRSPTLMLGKSFDTHGPIGPWLTTVDEPVQPQDLRIRTYVNGELRQDGSTSEMRYSVLDQIAYLSRIFTLEPGDIIATGTPAGVGAALRPPLFLREGDIVRVEIEALGAIENRFVAAPGARPMISCADTLVE